MWDFFVQATVTAIDFVIALGLFFLALREKGTRYEVWVAVLLGLIFVVNGYLILRM
jgi:cadmium resistance protein CadD (predicted permease)